MIIFLMWIYKLKLKRCIKQIRVYCSMQHLFETGNIDSASEGVFIAYAIKTPFLLLLKRDTI